MLLGPFKTDDFNLDDEKRSGQLKQFENKQLDVFIIGVDSLKVHFKSLRMIQKEENKVPYELTARQCFISRCETSENIF